MCRYRFDDNLIMTVRANLDPLFRYYALRKQVLKLDELHHYDTYVPIVSEFKRSRLDQAIELCLAALQPLGNDYVQALPTT